MEGGLAGIVEAEEEDGVFCQLSDYGCAGSGGGGINLLCWLRTDIGLLLGGTSSPPSERKDGQTNGRGE